MPGRVTLNVVEGKMKGKAFNFLEHDTFLLGRDPKCHVRLPRDPWISRVHFVLEVNPPRARLRDLGSRNGTYLNGERVGASARTGQDAPFEMELASGDRIRVGHTLIHVEIDAAVQCTECSGDIPSLPLTEPGTEPVPATLCNECRETQSVSGLESGPPVIPEDLDSAVRRLAARLAVDDADADTVAGYQVLRQLGAGGWGAVHLVRHPQTGRILALKVMRSEIAVAEGPRRRFMREVSVTKSLRHRNIVRLYDHGADGNFFYFTLEYCSGGDAGQLVREHGGRLPVDVAHSLLEQVLEGLAHAHERGFVHRDLKPANILLARDGPKMVAKVADFGLGKSFVMAGFSGFTLTGKTAGTADFMPPEQFENFKYVKPPCDVWSLAATFYEMLTGALPREGKPGDCGPNASLRAALHGRLVPIAERDPDLPPGLCQVLDRALVLDPAERFADAGEMLDTLRTVI